MSTSQTTDPSPWPENPTKDWLSKIVLRQAVKADLRAMEWEGEYTRYRRNYEEVFTRTKRSLAVMWLMELPGVGLVGQVLVQLDMDDRTCANGKTRAYIHSFRVREHLQGNGLGTWLMDHAEEDLIERGFREVTLNVAEENEGALQLYLRRGYQIIKHIPGRWSYYDDKGKLQHVAEPGFRLMKTLTDF
ncbi:MAG TPA: GNAT family N-acetyltransferase [Anaerolineales bacterium]|nr:GNAT family N-acetyltransferase [Anaerolineales bacterium]